LSELFIISAMEILDALPVLLEARTAVMNVNINPNLATSIEGDTIVVSQCGTTT